MLKKIVVWTRMHRPFTMGGSVWQNEGTKVRPYSVFTHKGRALAVVRNPKLSVAHIADIATGAFVQSGRTIKEAVARVKRDLDTADPEILAEQLASAAQILKNVTIVSEAEFWGQFKS